MLRRWRCLRRRSSSGSSACACACTAVLMRTAADYAHTSCDGMRWRCGGVGAAAADREKKMLRPRGGEGARIFSHAYLPTTHTPREGGARARTRTARPGIAKNSERPLAGETLITARDEKT